jgi:hypothetical protein
MSFGYVSVTNTPTLILGDNPQRLSLIIINGGSDVLHFAQDNTVSANNSPYLLPNGNLTEDSGGTKVYCGPFWGISTGGTSTVYWWERTR